MNTRSVKQEITIQICKNTTNKQRMFTKMHNDQSGAQKNKRNALQNYTKP